MKVLVLYSDVAPDAPPEEQDTLLAADAVGAALVRKGFAVSSAAFAKEPDRFAAVLEAAAPDVVFNLVEGIDGLGGLAPECPRRLAALGYRFTGALAPAMDLTNDKPATKAQLRQAGLVTPGWSVGPAWQGLDRGRWIVKSALEDASLGLDDACVVDGRDVPVRAEACTRRWGGDWFAEQYIEGREFNIALLQERGAARILPMAEMRFENWPAGKPRIVGYDAKWDEGSVASRQTVRHFGVEQEEPRLAADLRDACMQVWDLFDLSGFVRVDFRVTDAGTPLILEINTNPCISPDAGFAAAAAQAGMAYDDVIAAIVRAAL